MAITSAIMQMRRGLEADFDPDKMKPGEWAVSLDKKYVRMCFSVGVCVRMATYEAFEEDMAQIEEILSTCETIEEAVSKINTEVSANAKAVAEYTEQAKKYRDEAKTFRDEAEAFAPDGYDELKETVASNTVKIDTIIEKAELNIKNSASGENIHLTDSANGKNVEFGLYGKAEQKQYSGKNLLENTAESQTYQGITYTINADGSITMNGTATTNSTFNINNTNTVDIPNGDYILSCKEIENVPNGFYFSALMDNADKPSVTPSVHEKQISVSDDNKIQKIYLYITSGVTISNVTIYPMIRLASITDDTYEPYVGGIASPNPDYPQEITVSGSDGSVEVKSIRKNLLKNFAKSQTVNGVTFTIKNGIVTANGTSTSTISFSVASRVSDKFKLPVGKYILSGCPSGGSWKNYLVETTYTNQNNTSTALDYDMGDGKNIEITESMLSPYFSIGYNIVIQANVTLNNLVFKPMIRLASDTDDTYEPYKETVSTIPTENGLAGIKVSSGGNYTDENGQQWITDEIVKYADGSGEYVQRIGIDTLGNYDYTASVFNGDIYAFVSAQPISNALFSNSSKLLCEKFTASGTGANNTMYVTGTGNIRCFTSSYTTAEEFKTAMSNSKLYYELAEPIITDLTAEEIAEIEKLHTFYPVTNISNDSDCGMAVTYIADSKLYIDNQLAIQKAQQEEALATMLLLMPEEVQASMIENDTNNLLNESEV